jgi:hypothetical protein
MVPRGEPRAYGRELVKLRLVAPVAAAAVAVLALGTGVALAEDAPAADPQVVQSSLEVACGTVTVELKNLDSGDYGFHYLTGPWNGGPAGNGGLIVVKAGETVTKTVRYAEDSFDGQGFFTLGVAYGPNTHKQVFVDRGPIDTDCEPPAEQPPADEGPVDEQPPADEQPAAGGDDSPADDKPAGDEPTPAGDEDNAPAADDDSAPPAALVAPANYSQVGEVPSGAIDTGRA